MNCFLVRRQMATLIDLVSDDDDDDLPPQPPPKKKVKARPALKARHEQNSPPAARPSKQHATADATNEVGDVDGGGDASTTGAPISTFLGTLGTALARIVAGVVVVAAAMAAMAALPPN